MRSLPPKYNAIVYGCLLLVAGRTSNAFAGPEGAAPIVASALNLLEPGPPVDAIRSYDVDIDAPIEIDIGPHDDVLSLAPDRLTVVALDGNRVRLVGGPRVGQAALLVFTGAESHTLVVRVVQKDIRERLAERVEDAERARFSYSGFGSVAQSVGSKAQVTTAHSLYAGQQIGEEQWSVDGMVRNYGDDWALSNANLDYQTENIGAHLGDNYINLSAEQLALGIRGVRAEAGSGHDLRAGMVAGWQRTSASSFLQMDGPPLIALYGTAQDEHRFGDAQVGVIAGEDGPRLMSRTSASVRNDTTVASVDLAQLGAGGAATANAQWAFEGSTVRARTLVQSKRFSLESVPHGNRLNQDVSGSWRVNREWAISGLSAFAHEGRYGDLLATSMAVAGTGARWSPVHALQLSGNYHFSVGGDSSAVSFASHNLGLGVQRGRDQPLFGSAQGDVKLTHGTGLEAGRYAFELGYGDPNLWSFSTYVRGSRVGELVSERYGISAERISERMVMGADMGLSHTGVAGASFLLPSFSGHGNFDVVQGLALVTGGSYRLGLGDAQTSTWRLDSGLTVKDDLELQNGVSLALAGVVAGVAFNDRNGNGVQDPDDLPIPGLDVHLDEQRHTVTNQNGVYHFGSVTPGLHKVSVTRGSWRTVAGAHQMVRVDWLRRTTAPFPMQPGGRIEGRVFIDISDNGHYDNGEPGVPTKTIELRDSNGVVVDTARVEGGVFRFRGVDAGRFTVALGFEQLPVGIVSTELERSVSVRVDRTTDIEFPMQAMRSISGQVLVDINENSQGDTDDDPAAGVWVHLSDGRAARTDANGLYLFRGLSEGRYTVWVQDGGKSRSVYMPVTAHEAPRTNLLVSMARYAMSHEDDALLAIRSRSPIVHALAGIVMPDPFVAIQRDHARVELLGERDLKLSDEAVLAATAGGVMSLVPGSSEVQVTVGGIPSTPIQVEVLDRQWVDARAQTTVSVNVDERSEDVRGVLASAGRDVIPLGSGVLLSATAVYNDGTVSRLDQNVNWRVEDGGIVTVTPDGWLTATTPGTARVYASVEGAESQAVDIEVVSDPIKRLQVAMDDFQLEAGAASTVGVTALHQSARRTDVTKTVEWWVIDADVAQVAADGTILGVAEGRTKMWATIDGVESPTIDIVVHPVRLVGLAASVPESLVLGDRWQPGVSGVSSDGEMMPVTGARWTTENAAVVDVLADGTLVAVGRGKTTLIARSGSIQAVSVVQVRKKSPKRPLKR